MPATLPWPKMPKHPAKKRRSTPSRSTYWLARNLTSAWAIVSLIAPTYLPPSTLMPQFLETAPAPVRWRSTSPSTLRTAAQPPFQKPEALADVQNGSIPLLGLRLDHDILLHHVPPRISRALEHIEQPPDIHVALTQRPERTPAGCLLEADLPRPEATHQTPVDVLEVDVDDPIGRPLGNLDGVAASDHQMPRVQTQPRIAALHKAPELLVGLDHGPVVGVQREGEAVPGGDLLRPGEVLEELLPHRLVQLDDLVVALRAGC